MKLAKVLVVFKKSTYQLQAVEYKEPRFLQLLEEGHVTLSKVKTAHDEHYATLEALEIELKKRKINYDLIARIDLKDEIKDVDLVISVGGDGTFLDVSHMLKDIPLLGINSAKSTSFGHFCLADKNNIGSVLDSIQNGQLEPCPLLRLKLILNKKELPHLILNEVLVCHSHPAGTSRYYISLGNKTKEEQRSSGIWIATPAGSTGAIKSAGGKIMPIGSRQYQYVVREAWTRPGQKFAFTEGLLPEEEQLHIISHMRTGAIYIDGQHIEYEFPLGDELTICKSSENLIAFVDRNVNNIFLES